MRRLMVVFSVLGLTLGLATPAFATQAPVDQQNGTQVEQKPDRGARRAAVRGTRQGRTGQTRDFAERIKRLDKDDNGVISREEWPRRAEVFNRLDIDKDGSLTAAELQEARKQRPRGRRR